mmetsp:Transcript_61639/g.144526  ORF Transcript_61639/g.144526 Transcript_61639/m.144526 type:complete len:527 (-) Transcript_61639:44-1624(-)
MATEEAVASVECDSIESEAVRDSFDEFLSADNSQDLLLWRAGSRSHVAEHFELQRSEDSWKLAMLLDVRPLLSVEDLTRCADLKIRAAYDFIDSLPRVVETWTMQKVKPKRYRPETPEALAEIQEGVGEAKGEDSPGVPETDQPEEMPENNLETAGELVAREGSKRRAAVVTLQQTESPEDEKKRDDEAYFPEKNRLKSALSEAVIRDICKHFYDGAVVENPPWNLRVSSVEAALLAWDLTSNIHGCYRLPLTVVTKREGKQYSFIFVLVVLNDSVALLGRYLLKDISFLPLERRKVSEAVDHIATLLRDREYELVTLYLGLPTEALVGPPGDSPTYWRVLKLSCRRQEWNSILSSCDVYVARRNEVCAVLEEATVARRSQAVAPLPQGLELWLNARAEIRLKVVEPLLVRRRIKKTDQVPQAGRLTRPAGGGIASMNKESVSNLSMKMGRMQQKQRREQDEWHSLAAHPKFQSREASTVPADWPLVHETECSSVSSESLEEYAEDFRVDRRQIRASFQAHSQIRR